VLRGEAAGSASPDSQVTAPRSSRFSPGATVGSFVNKGPLLSSFGRLLFYIHVMLKPLRGN